MREHPFPSDRRHGMALATAIVMALLLVPIVPAEAVPPDTPIVIDGGGWGHNIGMPQYGARGMADNGYTHDEIINYWYTGVGLAQVADLNGIPVPEQIRVGIDYVLFSNGTKEFRPFRWQDFTAINGNISICLPGETEGACSLTAAPEEPWRFRWWDDDGGRCVLTRNNTVVYQHPTECDVSLFWGDQPNTRVNFPGSDVARTFARGHIDFLAPVTVNGVTGFHLNIVLTLEEYMYGLAEMPVSWHLEALKAQVVTARTFAAWKARVLRPECSCHLRWDTRDQSYRGWHSLNEGNETFGQRWVDAVNGTAGEVVVYPAGSGDLAETYYSSSSGGATENEWEVWGPGTADYATRYSYLASQPDPWSVLYATTPTENTTVRWRQTRTAGQIVSALADDVKYETAAFPGLTALHSIEIVALNTSGSPSLIEVTGVANGVVTTKQFVSRGPTAGQSTIGTLVYRLGLRGHFIYSFEGFLEPERWAGSDRYETAAAVSQQTHPGGADIVYLTVGTNHPDAIAAGPAAAAEGAPILLVTATGLPAVTALELQRLDPQQVVIVGGEVAIAAAVATQVAAVLPGAEVTRRAGHDRYATAAAVSQAAFPGGAGTVFIAGGEGFPDAVVAAPAAIQLGGPLLLVPQTGVPATVRAEITRLAPTRVVVVGGTGAVSAAAFAELSALAATVERISGPNRYSVAVAVSSAFFAPGATAYIAVGTDFPDALAAGPASAASPGPVLLVQSTAIPATIAAELSRLQPHQIVILGGLAAVSLTVEEALTTYLQ